MRTYLNALVGRALRRLKLPRPDAVRIERARARTHGDFACNAALVLARTQKINPRELAQEIIDALPGSPYVDKVELAGPGFINFHLAPAAYHALVHQIHAQGERFGHRDTGRGTRVLLEFVSANPTGPLHVGHGRGAAYGDSLARVMRAAGFDVHGEYYVNDAGRQMNILTLSVWLRYLELCGDEVAFPGRAYQGDYIWDIAAALHRKQAEALQRPGAQVFKDLPQDEEQRLDALIARARGLLGESLWQRVHRLALDTLTENIRKDLVEFGVEFHRWFSEREVTESGEMDKAIALLRQAGHLYEKDGALWFRSTDFGDEKDRVVIRENGQSTYFASDIAYHLDKLDRGFDLLIDIWGADHHGYIPRVRAALEAMGRDADAFKVLLVQFAALYRGGEKVAMSTRGGDFVTLRELREEVGNDAARFFYVMRKSEQHMDFDLDLAKSQSSDNPVYYVQYAHARICSVFRQLTERGEAGELDIAGCDLTRLDEDRERALLVTLSRFPETVESAAMHYEPHQIAYYLQELANDFHTYYNAHTFLTQDVVLREARLVLIDAARRVLANGLHLLGVGAPERM